jgi:dTDP-glucose 4,6-dehydratase
VKERNFSKSTILVTGGAGFIGSNFIYLLNKTYPNTKIINFDKLTYAGNIENLNRIKDNSSYQFVCGDISSKNDVTKVFDENDIDTVVHFAAESHVDRSIKDASPFIKTNIQGTVNLMDVALEKWADKLDEKLFLHVSTDEVYGSLGKTGVFTEETPLTPNNPYSSSKAASDMMVLSYVHTHKFPAIITRCSNNYGPFQFPEKLIPLTIINITQKKKIPIYGDGKQIRDWIFVTDHCEGISAAMKRGKLGEAYNFGGEAEIYNIDLVTNLCNLCNKSGIGSNSAELMTHVTDRPGHDRRYAMGIEKARRELDWNPRYNIEDALHQTVGWYLDNRNWWNNLLNREYEDYYAKQYGDI